MTVQTKPISIILLLTKIIARSVSQGLLEHPYSVIFPLYSEGLSVLFSQNQQLQNGCLPTPMGDRL